MLSDIRPQWLNVARRCQSVACKQNGISLVTMKILVGADGNPIVYQEPFLIKIEPISQVERLLELLAKLD